MCAKIANKIRFYSNNSIIVNVQLMQLTSCGVPDYETKFGSCKELASGEKDQKA